MADEQVSKLKIFGLLCRNSFFFIAVTCVLLSLVITASTFVFQGVEFSINNLVTGIFFSLFYFILYGFIIIFPVMCLLQGLFTLPVIKFLTRKHHSARSFKKFYFIMLISLILSAVLFQFEVLTFFIFLVFLGITACPVYVDLRSTKE